MNRRSFLGRATGAVCLFVLGGISLLTEGCDGNVFTDLENWIPVGLSAVSSILTLLSGAGIALAPAVTTVIGLIQAGLNDLKLAIVQYESTSPPPSGVLSQIDTFLSDLVSNIGNVLAQLPTMPSNDISLAVGLFELLLSTIQGFMAQVPSASSSLPKSAARLKQGFRLRSGLAVAVAIPKNLSRRHFIHSFNALTEAGGHKELDLHESLVQHL